MRYHWLWWGLNFHHTHLWALLAAVVVLAALSLDRRALIALVLVVFVLALAGCASLPTVAESSWQAAHAVDVVQTIDGPARDPAYQEDDPLTRRIIGRHPSVAGVLAWGVGESVLHGLAWRWLIDHGHPRLASAFSFVTLVPVIGDVAGNRSIGIRIVGRNEDDNVPAVPGFDRVLRAAP